MRMYHFMRYKWWFLLSLSAVTIFAIITVFVVRLDLGIDFRGGVRMQVGLEQPATVDAVRSVVRDIGVQEPVVQSVAGAGGAGSFMITAEEMDKAKQDQITAELDSRYGVVAGSTGVEEVGASFGEETTNRAFIAVAIAIVVIIGYLTFRFEFKFAIPAIVALIHDVGLTLGIYSASNRLVTASTVAAILTILGYSLHDTIIVFDRMRENTLLMKRGTYSNMADLSISQTMARSINTTVCILLPLVAILIFGGPTLKDFAFALTIGVITGTYSSFFVATPLAVIWKEREPRYRKRLMAAAEAAGGLVVDTDPATNDAGTSASSSKSTRSAVISGTAGSVKVGRSGGSHGTSRKSGRVSQKPRKGKTENRPAAKDSKRTSR